MCGGFRTIFFNGVKLEEQQSLAVDANLYEV